MRRAVLLLCVPLLWASIDARADEGVPACKVLVLTLDGRALPEADKELPALLSETLSNEVGAVSGCEVISQQEIRAMLEYEKQKAVCTDGSDSCLAEIGEAYGADRVVAGTLGKLGAEYQLSVRLMNVRQGAVERRAEQPVTRAPEQLRRAAKNAGRQLFGVAPLPDEPVVTEAEAGSPALWWTGVALAGVGGAVLLGGGALLALAETQLADPANAGKDAARQTGQLSLVAMGVGAAVLVAGGVMALLGAE